MRKITRESVVAVGLCMSVLVLAAVSPVAATTSRSPNFEVSETEFGAGAALETCSGSYCARATIGETASGESSSANYTAEFGSIPSDSEPMLEMFIEPGQSDLGQLDTDRTATRVMHLNVRSHLAGGYTVQVIGTPPRYENHALLAPELPTPSIQGAEQFALNLVANTDPEVGENPLLLPEEQSVTDVVMPRYATPNLFAYASGDVVARTVSESSQIRYTISMIVNVSGKTPAGHYTGDFSTVVTPVF